MIEDELRAHYATTRVDPRAQERLLALLLEPPRRRNVRTGLAISGSIAAVGALALVVTLVPGHGSGNTPVGAGSDTGPASTAAGSTVVSATPSASSARAQVTPQVVVQNLISLVSPSGTATSPGGRTVSNTVAGQVVFDDGHGAAQIDIAVTWTGTAPHDAVPQACTASPSCTVLPDGTTVAIQQGLEYPANPSRANNATEWSVQVYRPSDNLEVDISEWNAPTEKDSAISRPAPPFTIAELTTMATSPSWSATATTAAISAASGLFVPDVMPGNLTTPATK